MARFFLLGSLDSCGPGSLLFSLVFERRSLAASDRPKARRLAAPMRPMCVVVSAQLTPARELHMPAFFFSSFLCVYWRLAAADVHPD